MFARPLATMLALAAFGTCCSIAHAQSNVVLFGVLDVAARQVTNGSLGTNRSEVSGSNMSSRWGLRGTESLGGDLSAGFWLESAVAANTGAAGATVPASFFDRRSTLSLFSKKLGELRVGRDYVPTFLAMSASDPFTAVGLGSTNTFVSQSATRAMNQAFGASTNANTTGRFNSSVHYFTPEGLGGFFAQLSASLGEGQANSGSGRSKTAGLRIGYANGPLAFSFASLNTKNTLVAGESFSDQVLSGSYDFGVVKLRLTQRNFEFRTDKQSTTWLAATAPLGGGTLKVSLSRADQSGATAALNENDATMAAVGYVYDLSKRTAVYGHAARVSNKGAATFTLTGGPAVSAATFGGKNSTGFEFGVRHRF